MEKICPNYNGCRLVQTNVVVPDDAVREQTIKIWCHREETWKNCKRYITRKSLWMCPDFVLPETEMTEDEIIELYEKQGKKKDG